MGRPLNPTPSYVYHPKGIGRIYWRGEFRNLPGDFNSPESLSEYHRLCQHVAATGVLPKENSQPITVQEVCDRFAAYAKRRYDGPREPRNLGYAMAALLALFAGTPAAKLGPSALKAVRASIVASGLCRNTANKRARQIVMIWQWAVEEELIEPAVWQALKAVKPIPKGREGAIDYEPKRPVPLADYRRVHEAIAPRYRPALEVQRLTGMRSGELLAMRPQDVDMSGPHWYYRLRDHKTQQAVGTRIVGIPSPAADVLRACMPRTWGHRWFAWSVDVHYHAVVTKCERLGIARWTPHQLRHSVATLCNELFGPDVARMVLGHTSTRTTAHYIMATAEALGPVMDAMAERIK